MALLGRDITKNCYEEEYTYILSMTMTNELGIEKNISRQNYFTSHNCVIEIMASKSVILTVQIMFLIFVA